MSLARVAKFVFVAVLLMCIAAPSPAAPERTVITVQDIIDGIKQRRTDTASIKVRYQIRTTPTDAGQAQYRMRLDELEQNSTASSDSASGPDQQDEYSPQGELLTNEQNESRERNLEARRLLATTASQYGVAQRGEKRSFVIHEILESGDPREVSRGAYDGEILKSVSGGTSGSIARAAPAEVLMFPTISLLAGVNDIDLETYLETSRSQITVAGTEQQDGDLLVNLVRREPLPVIGEGAVTRIEEIAVNASKDFWPRKITVRIAAVIPNRARFEPVVEETLVSSYWESNGHFYPKEIKRTAFAAIPPPGKAARGSWQPTEADYQVVATRTVAVESVEVNGTIEDDEFILEFPPGTRYLDKVRDGIFVVDLDGTIREMADVIGAPVLPVDKVRREDADRIIRAENRIHSGAANRTWLAAAAVFLICVATGLALARRLSRAT